MLLTYAKKPAIIKKGNTIIGMMIPTYLILLARVLAKKPIENPYIPAPKTRNK